MAWPCSSVTVTHQLVLGFCAAAGADLRNAYPGAHLHQHPHTHGDGTSHGGLHSHGHDHAHDREAASDGGHDGYGVGLANDGGFDMSGLGATDAEIAAVLDAVCEADEEGWASQQAGDADLAAWAASLTDDDLAVLEAEAALDGYQGGPELAAVLDGGYLDMTPDAIDAALAAMTDREALRQRQDAAEQGKRRGSVDGGGGGRDGLPGWQLGQHPDRGHAAAADPRGRGCGADGHARAARPDDLSTGCRTAYERVRRWPAGKPVI